MEIHVERIYKDGTENVTLRPKDGADALKILQAIRQQQAIDAGLPRGLRAYDNARFILGNLRSKSSLSKYMAVRRKIQEYEEAGQRCPYSLRIKVVR